MIITHASLEKIEKVQSSYGPLRGCLCFGEEGNTYNLAGECNYQYNIEVNEDNILWVNSIFFHHQVSEFQELFDSLAMELGLEIEEQSQLIQDLLDETELAHSHQELFEDSAEAGWIVQQYQGLIACHLGYDAAQAQDEQGTVYIVDCRERILV